MKYFLDSAPVSFEQFQQKFPEESKILALWHSNDLEVWATEGSLSYRLGHLTKIGIDWSKTLERHMRTFYKRSPYQENLARALGIKKDQDRDLKVLDATAGLMSDSLMMLALGLRNLTLCERHPLLQVLVINTLKQSDKLSRLKFFPQDALELNQQFDVIFFDPMYQETNKRSASKKQMVFMREVVGTDEDADKIALNLRGICRRLVIKRSQKASPLLGTPNHQVKGKSTDYDIYFNND
ncbi:MAG: hypothetical protein CME65_06005 [Halobacteriovoraceae bacterium]|nr:hypothetical protein [Halobacteriovoraceae bacterium]|tara:strand:+ start:13922 stop:14638 length:717 start_codon:yes stop_codon:yes gene_type:complete